MEWLNVMVIAPLPYPWNGIAAVVALGVFIAIVVLSFQFCRELVCWYLKLTAISDSLTQMVELQKKTVELLGEIHYYGTGAGAKDEKDRAKTSHSPAVTINSPE